ncbi:MAG: DUF481 domain-containing protein [Puniceicoccaceae bacterium]|nr:MAG: DUF481 domain-containing protein [Puniceicoccaceae bacterium]
MRHYFSCLIFFLLGAHALCAGPSLVKLDSGEQLLGDVLPRSTDELLVLRSELLGEIEIPRARVLVIEPKVPPAEVAAAEPKPPKKPPVEAASKAKPAKSEPSPREVVADASKSEERRIIHTLREFKAPDHWSGNLRIGLNLSQGDRRWTETYARGNLEIKPPESPNFYRFSGSYTYRETVRPNGDTFKSTDRYDGKFTYRRTFSENWFFQNALGGRVDKLKGIDHEIQNTVGVGYRYKPSGKFEFLIGGGGGIEDLDTSFEDTRSGFNGVLNVFQEATWRPLNRTSFIQRFNYYWNPDNREQFNYVLSTAVRVRLTDLLGVEFSFNKNFDNDIGDGNARDDAQWRNALVVYF